MAQFTMQQKVKSDLKVKHTWSYGTRVFVRYDNDVTEEVLYPWYFLVDNTPEALALGKSIEGLKGVIHGKYVKVYGTVEHVHLFENSGIPTYEGDLLPDKRWYIDKEIEIGENFKKLYIDIETDDSEAKIKVGKDRILSWAAVDNKGKKYYETLESFDDESEEKLLLKFLKLIKRYDLILGWNSSEFDIPYLKDRMFKYELHRTKSYCWKELGRYDLLKRFRHIFRFDSHIKSFSLDYVSKHFLGKGKIEHTGKIVELWKTNKELLREYNLEDCLLVKELDEKLGVSEMMIRQSRWCGVPPSRFGLYSIIDSYILKKAHSIGKYGRTSMNALKDRDFSNETANVNPDETDTKKSKYLGAIVLDPKIGKYDNVYTFDFKGLYPSLMRTSNIGYDSLRYEDLDNRIMNPGTYSTLRLVGGVKPTFFDKEPSVINLAITDLITKRGEYKNLKLKMIEDGTNKGQDWERVVSDEIIVKELANSTYGIMGLEYGRYYSVDVAESITLFGQWCINYAKDYYEELGYNVIYGDTDSIFVSTGKETLDIDKTLAGFHTSVEEELKKYRIDKSFIQLNFDKQYDSFILVAKKTYVGHVINIEGKKTNDLYARGLEYHKKNTFSYAATKQKELIDMVLKGDKNIKKWCQDTMSEFFLRSFTKDELTLTQRVGKEADDYLKTPPLHVRLAQGLKEENGIDLYRTEIDFIITNTSSGIINGILAENYAGKFDRNYYWINKTQPVLQRILDIVYPGEDLFNVTKTLF